MEPKTKSDCYTEITNAIIADLEKGVRPWMKPWETDDPIPCRLLRITGEAYRGINILLLWCAAHRYGFRGSYWLTYQQARQLGGHVRKGEKGTMIVFASKVTKTERDENGVEEEREIPFLKSYCVFNVDQTEGLPEKYCARATRSERHDNERHEHTERFVANTKAEICHEGDRAYYSPLEDRIQLPPLDRFKDSDAYYSTVTHELTHWTNRSNRSPRLFRPTHFGTLNYAREELVAELGAAFLCADLQWTLTPRFDHAEYMSSWLEVLRKDKRAIFQAAAMAQKAVDFLHSLQQPDAQGETAEPTRMSA